MGSTNTRYVVNFGTQNLSSLIRARSVIRGIEQQSYISFNSASRSLSHLERTSNRSSNQITRSLDRINSSMRRLGAGGGRGGMGLLSMFSGLGAISFGVGALSSSIMLLHKAFVQTNTTMQSSRIMIEELLGSAGQADGFINKMKDLSASFGQDLTETMSASRGLMQVMKQVNTPQPVHLEKMLKMVMAVNAMDLENRGLAYTAFSFKEAFQGMGRGDFRSLRNRLEVNLGKEMETAITNAIKKGDLDKAIDLFDQGLQRIGINSDRLLRRLSNEGFLQNINRLSSYILRVFQVMGEPLFNSLTKPFARFNTYLATAFSNGSAISYLTNLGNEIRNTLAPVTKTIEGFIEQATSDVLKNPKNNIFTKFVNATRSSLTAFFSMMGLLKSFFMGALGITEGQDLFGDLVNTLQKVDTLGQNLTKTFTDLKPAVNEAGKSFGKVAKEGFGALQNFMPSGQNGLAQTVYDTSKKTVDTTSGVMGFLNEYGAIGSAGAIGLLLGLMNPKKSIGMLLGLGKKGLGKLFSKGGASSVDDVITATTRGGNREIFGRGSKELIEGLNAKKGADYLSGYSKQVKDQFAGANRVLSREGLKTPLTKLDPSKTTVMGFQQGRKTAFELSHWNKINKAKELPYVKPDIIKNPSFLSSIGTSISSKYSSFKEGLSTSWLGVAGYGLKEGVVNIAKSATTLSGAIAIIGGAFSLLGKISPMGIAISTGFIIKDIYDLYKAIGDSKKAEEQAVIDKNQSLIAQNKLTRYKKDRSMIEALAGGVSIQELNRQMKVGVHGLSVNKDNYEYFLSHGTDIRGKKAFQGLHSAYEAGLISPSALQQAMPQVYDIFSNKSQEMVHKGEIMLKGLEKNPQFVKDITDSILRELSKKYPKASDIPKIDEVTQFENAIRFGITQ